MTTDFWTTRILFVGTFIHPTTPNTSSFIYSIENIILHEIELLSTCRRFMEFLTLIECAAPRVQ